MGLSEHGDVRQMDTARDLGFPPQCSRSLKLPPIGYSETSVNIRQWRCAKPQKVEDLECIKNAHFLCEHGLIETESTEWKFCYEKWG